MTQPDSSKRSPGQAPRPETTQPQQEQQQQVSRERGSHTNNKKNPGKSPGQGGH